MRMMLGAVALVLAGCAGVGAAAGEGPRVKVAGGELQGAVENGVEVFRNIPFAAPPVGALRWAPPEPAKAWSGVRDAVKAGPACPQTMREDGKPNTGGAFGPTSEDCLQLNVYAPKGAAKAPVMVWIYGGSHRVGMSSFYDGTSFAKDGIVVVTVNYRLGALGYLSHPALGPRSGNYGLMDQIAALQWVKANVAQFGGDPGNVTLFGESAGGLSTMSVLSVPSARGLYHKAIVQSGGGWYPVQDVKLKEEQGVKLLAPTGATAQSTLEELRAIPVEKLAGLAGEYGPYPDGELMPETPTQAIAHGRFPDVPLMIGWNSGEDTLMGPSPLPEATLKQIPPIARMVYPKEAGTSDEALARVIFTDSLFGASARWVAAQTAQGEPSFLYHFSYIGEAYRASAKTAGHATEIPYVWDMAKSPVGDIGPGDRPVAELMHACWSSFAKTSRPACGTPPWPAYTAATDQLMEFATDSGIRTGFKKSAFTAQEMVWLPQLGLK